MSWGAIGGAAVGAVGSYLGSKGSKKSGGGGDVSQEPWSGLQPYLKDAYGQAQNLYNSGGPEFYPNATYVPFSPQTQMAMQLGENRALFGSEFDPAAGNVAMAGMSGNSPYNQAAMDSLWGSQLGMAGLSPTVQGQFLNSNPYLDNMFNAASRSVGQQYSNTVMPGINATFGSGGRTGSNAHQTALDTANQSYTNNLTDMASNIYGNNYANERTNQLNAANQYANLGQNLAQQYSNLGGSQFNQQLAGANLGMMLGQQDWSNIDRLGQIGGMVEGQGQKVLDDYMNRFNFYQNRPEQNLMQYANILNGLPGGNLANSNTNSPDGSAAMSFFGNLAQNYAANKWGNT